MLVQHILLAAVGGIPDPAPAAPPGQFSADVSKLLAWWKWVALIAGVFGLIGCGAMMAIGRRGRSSMSVDAAVGVPWVLAGLTLIVTAAGIVGLFV